MIAYLSGEIIKILEKEMILNVSGVGYLIHCPGPTIERTTLNQIAEFYIFTRVREDDISLYGFETLEELNFFKLLLSVNGVGAKTALDIMSQNLDNVKNAIAGADTAFLSKIPGIGKKTAERIIVELKSKIDFIPLSREHGTVLPSNDDNEAVDALINLGYQKYEILRVLKNLPGETKQTEEVITYFLRNV